MDSHETSDLLDHFKIDAETLPEDTMHVTTKSVGKQVIKTRWYRKRLLGRGSFDHVYMYLEADSQDDDNAQIRAVKILHKDDLRHFVVDWRKEVEALAKLSKPKYLQEGVIVPLFAWFENEKDIFLSMEYYPLGDLACHIDGTATEVEAKQITSDLLAGLKIMHHEGFVHRDLKPTNFEQNIFVAQRPPASKTWWVKIGASGLTNRVRNDKSAFRSIVGTQAYMAPEILKIRGTVESSTVLDNYSSAVNLWSLGCIIYEILSNTRPFQKSFSIQRYCRGEHLPVEQFIGKLGDEGLHFLGRLLSIDPAQRPTAQAALEAPWLRKISASSVLQDKFSFHADSINDAEITLRPMYQEETHDSEDHARTTKLEAPSRIPAPEALQLPLVDSTVHVASSTLRFDAHERYERREEAMRLLAPTGYVPRCGSSDSNNSSHANAFVYAARHGNDEALRLFIESGIDVDEPTLVQGVTTWWSTTALYEAVPSGHTTTVEILLDAQANTQAGCTYSNSKGIIRADYAIHAAARSSPEMSRLLLDAGAVMELTDSDGNTALHQAALLDNPEILHCFLENGANVHARNLHGDTPLHVAVWGVHVEIVRILLDARSDINAMGVVSNTPLSAAFSKGDMEIIRLLIERGASLDVKGDRGRSLLQYAVLDAHLDAVRFALGTNPDMKWKDLDGWTALHCVTDSLGTESVSIARLLLDNGSDIDERNHDGQTTLHLASELGQKEMVRFLIAAGANCKIKDHRKASPRDLARRKGHKDVVTLLEGRIQIKDYH
ncbi:Ankyrin-2 [Xylographa trunciseda]|nr:Ankyrin-2 [Xylographa trunciseda]